RRHRASMPHRERGFFRGRRLSAGRKDARHAADPGELPEGAEDDSASHAAEVRSGAGRGWSAGQAMESAGVVAEPPCPVAAPGPNSRPHWPIHIAIARTSRITANAPKAIRPIG